MLIILEEVQGLRTATNLDEKLFDGVSRSGNPGDDGDKGLGGAWEKR